MSGVKVNNEIIIAKLAEKRQHQFRREFEEKVFPDREDNNNNNGRQDEKVFVE